MLHEYELLLGITKETYNWWTEITRGGPITMFLLLHTKYFMTIADQTHGEVACFAFSPDLICRSFHGCSLY